MGNVKAFLFTSGINFLRFEMELEGGVIRAK